ncbi:hypothetical protein [Microbacterium aurantiacum]|uniref:hypothetical protein n=1 Tax=Microbacterium aurantiacum TaxID=162393 RepID=UPI000C7FCD40|nr:hypothetical protein [Microbacterium aurantiacum]
MILFKNGCYAVAGALLLVVAGLAGFGGVDAMYAQGWMIVLLLVFAISGLIVEIDQHVFPDKPPAAEEDPVTAASPTAIPHTGTSATRQTVAEPGRPTARVIIPGVTLHGRMRASLNIQTGAHKVTWATNRKFAGTLRAGAKDGWDVYDVDDELLGWRPDIRAGMELLEETAD